MKMRSLSDALAGRQHGGYDVTVAGKSRNKNVRSATPSDRDLERDIHNRKRRECLDKRKFRSLAEIEMHIGIEARRTGVELSSYKCVWCKRWHLTSRP